ncbi:hypothetical protein [Reichenbachiella sp.]
MANPILTVVAGCNGSGKSSFSSALTPENTPPFDYDKEFLNIYKREYDSDVRDVVAHNKTRQLLEEKVKNSIDTNSSFTYETNFNSTPLFWPEKFKDAKFKLRLFYFCLNSIDEAKRRVQVRVENGGHHVPPDEIELRYYLGYEHLNKYWKYFDELYLFETSAYKEEPRLILTSIEDQVEREDKIPDYLNNLIPDILSER